VAAIAGLRTEVTYEAQAAIELEAISCQVTNDRTIYPFILEGEEVKVGPLLAQVVAEVQTGVSPNVIGWRFHQTLAEMIRAVCSQVREQEKLTAVALSGGCFQNRLLLSATTSRLKAAGFTVYIHRQVPANDGGISLGQAVVAAARLRE
jgi:hydrogenase maturation protein HypF